MIAEISINFK